MKRTFFTIVSASAVSALLFFIGPTLLFPQSKQAKITWLPPGVYAGITRTSTISKSVTFASDQILENVVLEAVPEIAGFIKIQPNKLSRVPAKQPQTVQLIFSAPLGAQFGAYNGTIHVRVGNTTIPQTLKSSVTFAVVPLPPDPGDAGKTTLAGIDSDNDGIRDDVQRYIVFTIPSSEKHREALKMEVKGIHNSLLAQTKEQSFQAAIVGVRTIECLSYLGKRKEYRWKEVLALMLNTKERILAFEAHEARINGQVIHSLPRDQERSACTFNVEALSN